MSRARHSWAFLLLPLLALAGPDAAEKPAPREGSGKPRVAFVYVSPVGDLGWTWAHDEARALLEQELGVETTAVESVPEGPAAEPIFRRLAQEGYDVIISTSAGFEAATAKVAPEFPKTRFLQVAGTRTGPNLSTVFGRMIDARYLSGLVAGRMTKSGVVGYVAAYPIPEVIRGIDAFTLGVRQANPGARVRVVWTNSWHDPEKERSAALSLLDGGADIIAQHQDGLEPQLAAKERGALSIGYDADMGAFVGDTVLTSPVWNWGPTYVEIVKRLLSGGPSQAYDGGLKDGLVDLAPLSPRVPADVRRLVAEKRRAIVSGGFLPLCGPINAQDGHIAVRAGRCVDRAEQQKMDWFVEGVEGRAPGVAPGAPPVGRRPSR